MKQEIRSAKLIQTSRLERENPNGGFEINVKHMELTPLDSIVAGWERAAMVGVVLPEILSLSREALTAQFKEWGEPAYRVDQLLQWLYRRHVTSWSDMTNLSKALRQRLGETYLFHPLELKQKQGARDTTQKFLWKLSDGNYIESVLIPANPSLYGEASDRHTLCISTQVGCAYGCRFCASGLDGWKRNLGVHEIVGQVLATEQWHQTQPRTTPPLPEASLIPESNPATVPNPTQTPTESDPRLVNNIVVMGMGEPLANYDSLLAALRLLNAPWGGNIGARKITISTSGLVPQIKKLAEDPLQFRLAISLHGATDDVRSQIMPVNKKYPLAELTSALDYYQKRKGRMITFEYILIEGINDSPSQIAPLAHLARRLHAKVNLIPYNTVEGLPWNRPSEHICESFSNALQEAGITATLRLEKGHDIDAACGQLRLKTEISDRSTSVSVSPKAPVPK